MNFWWEKIKGLEEGLIPFKIPIFLLTKINLPQHSTRIMNRIRNKGSPFLKPLEGSNFFEGDPLIRAARDIEEIN